MFEFDEGVNKEITSLIESIEDGRERVIYRLKEDIYGEHRLYGHKTPEAVIEHKVVTGYYHGEPSTSDEYVKLDGCIVDDEGKIIKDCICRSCHSYIRPYKRVYLQRKTHFTSGYAVVDRKHPKTDNLSFVTETETLEVKSQREGYCECCARVDSTYDYEHSDFKERFETLQKFYPNIKGSSWKQALYLFSLIGDKDLDHFGPTEEDLETFKEYRIFPEAHPEMAKYKSFGYEIENFDFLKWSLEGWPHVSGWRTFREMLDWEAYKFENAVKCVRQWRDEWF